MLTFIHKRHLLISMLALVLLASTALGKGGANQLKGGEADRAKTAPSQVEQMMERIKPSVVSIYATEMSVASKDLTTNFSTDNWSIKSWFAPDFTGTNAVSFVGDWAPLAEPRKWLGSGLLMDNEGHILVHQQLLDGTAAWEVMTYDGKNYAAELIGSDESTGYTILRIQVDNLPAAKLGTLSAPSGEAWTKTPEALYSKLGIEIASPGDYFNRFFSVKLPIPGVMITKVMPDSPAAKAGLKAGDLISSVGGDSITTSEALFSHLQKVNWNDAVMFTVQGQVGQRNVSFVLLER